MTTFRTFLKSKFCDENLNIYIAVQTYKYYIKKNAVDKAKELAGLIYRQYVPDDAPECVNLDHKVRSDLDVKLNEALFDGELFEMVESAVVSLLSMDSLTKFHQSDVYLEYEEEERMKRKGRFVRRDLGVDIDDVNVDDLTMDQMYGKFLDGKVLSREGQKFLDDYEFGLDDKNVLVDDCDEFDDWIVSENFPNGLWREDTVSLSIKNCQISKIPPVDFISDSLKELCFAGNKLSTFPAPITSFYALKILDLSKNYITEIPQSLGALICLENLILNNNRIKTLGPTISFLNNLMLLDISHNFITSFDEICDLTFLETILIDNNQVKSIPVYIDRMKSLKYISLESNNALIEVPFSIVRSDDLEINFSQGQRFGLERRLTEYGFGPSPIIILTQFIKEKYEITKEYIDREYHWINIDICPICQDSISFHHKKNICKCCGLNLHFKCSKNKILVPMFNYETKHHVCDYCFTILDLSSYSI